MHAAYILVAPRVPGGPLGSRVRAQAHDLLVKPLCYRTKHGNCTLEASREPHRTPIARLPRPNAASGQRDAPVRVRPMARSTVTIDVVCRAGAPVLKTTYAGDRRHRLGFLSVVSAQECVPDCQTTVA